ncbi:MAG: dephospho-CoA kinase [Chloroflexi bacterium]|nr:dephospho-CoA kinase [Chloroflexota bacterium]
MFIIGLTGNIGTGKSTVMKLLAELGAETIDADRVAHEVMEPGGPAYLKVIGAFGRDIVKPDGAIDRKRLGEVVFRDAARLRQLEQVVHPVVEERIVERLQANEKPVLVIEAIKLIEAGLTALCNEVWVVTSPEPVQRARLKQTRGMGDAEARMRINAQPPQAEKVKAAGVVIENTGSLDELKQKVTAEWARVQAALSSQTTSV